MSKSNVHCWDLLEEKERRRKPVRMNETLEATQALNPPCVRTKKITFIKSVVIFPTMN